MQLRKKYWLLTAVIAGFLIVLFLVYRPTLFNFIISDDFSYLIWAHQAVQHPNLLWEKYFGDAQKWTTSANILLFYRPFLHTILLLEYKLWGLNGLYFRILNIVIELLSGLMLGLIIVALNNKDDEEPQLKIKQSMVWPLLSAALFVLYPLHSESVNWASDQVDLLVALFSLISLWCYIQWRAVNRQMFYILSIAGAILAFLTKETAVAIPFTIFFYELVFQNKRSEVPEIAFLRTDWIRRIAQSFIATSSYWMVLILYLCLRKMVLGDFIAGYPDSVCYVTVYGWLQGLGKIFVPINTLVIGTHSYIFKSWHIVSAIAILLSIISMIRTNNQNRKVIYFLVVWFLSALAPAYKIFPNVMGCGTGGRIAYLATAPVSAFLTYGLASFATGYRFSLIARLTAFVFIGLAGIILYLHNQLWAEAGRYTNKVVQELRNSYQTMADDPPVYITGLPIDYKGIFNLGVLVGITKKPIFDRNLFRCVRLDNNEQYVDIGFLKEALANNQKNIHLLYWERESRTLKPVSAFPNKNTFTKNWRGRKLMQIMHVSSLTGLGKPEVHCLDDGTIEIKSNEKENTCIMIELDLTGLPCWNIDCIGLKIQFVNLKTFGYFAHTELLFANKIAKNYSKDYRSFDCCSAPIKATNKEQEILFQLRNMPFWTMGDKCSSIRLILPIEKSIKVRELYIPETKSLIPHVQVQSLAVDPPGQIRLDKKYQTMQRVQYNADSISDCKQVMLEVLPGDSCFESRDSVKASKTFFLKKRSSSSSGQFIINRNEFPVQTGVYKGRIRALDATGNQVGFSGDTFSIFVDS